MCESERETIYIWISDVLLLPLQQQFLLLSHIFQNLRNREVGCLFISITFTLFV